MRVIVGRAALVLVVSAIALAGCKKESEGPGAAAGGKGAVKAETGSLSFPADVIAFGGVKSLDDFTGKVSGLVGKFSPQMSAMIGAQLPALLQGQVLGVKDLKWLDGSRPLAFVFLNHKKFDQPMVVVAPVKDKQALEQAIPEGKQAGVDGNEFKYPLPMGGEVFLNRVGDKAVFTMHPGAFKAVESFLKGGFGDYPFKELLDVQVSVANLSKVAANEISAFLDQMKQAPQGQPDMMVPGMQKMLDKEAALLRDLLDQTKTARFTIGYDGKKLVLNAGVEVLPGKELAGFVAGMKDRNLSLYKRLPGDGWLTIASNVDPKLGKKWIDIGVDFWADMLQMNDKDRAELVGLMNKAVEVQTGESAFQVGFDGEFPFKVVSMTGVKDAGKAKGTFYALYGMLFRKMGDVLQKMAPPKDAEQLAKLDWSSPKALVASMKPIIGESGLEINIVSRKVAGADVDAMLIDVDYSKVPIASGDEDVRKITGLVGNKLSAALAFKDDLVYGMFGKDALADLEKAVKGGQGSGVLDAIIREAGGNVALAGYFSLKKVFDIIAQVDPEITMGIPGLAKVQGDMGVSLTVGSRGDRVIDASLVLPIADIASLMPSGNRAGLPPGPPSGVQVPLPPSK